MEHRVVPWRLPVPAQDVLLALFITVMQVQGTIVRNADEVVQRPLADLGNLGTAHRFCRGEIHMPVPVKP
ncbi:hypothetical protein AB0B56_28295 [Streptosporangium canum]|uniref:hypothetical protein n=1 Tax=Streptosporangium canum TaxID=324952 RepID=UPI0034240225